jgi:methenyltetrahydrofolate cyclohydrolase
VPGRRAHRHRRARRDSGPLLSETADTPDYLQLPLSRFLGLVASGDPAPAGGSVAAVAVALAAALSAMAARLSAEHLADAPKLAKRADSLRSEAAPLARADAVAYGRVLAAQRTGEGDVVHDALSRAADIPVAVAKAGVEVAEISAHLARDGNPNLRGDAIAAALLAEAGARAATWLAKINLSSAGIEDGRLGHADELVEAAAAARQAAEAMSQGTSQRR